MASLVSSWLQLKTGNPSWDDYRLLSKWGIRGSGSQGGEHEWERNLSYQGNDEPSVIFQGNDG